jgi:hypothetical protein
MASRDVVTPASAHVLLAWEFADDLEVETARTLRLCVCAGSRVTVAFVAVPQRVLAYGMPFCGVALIEQVQEGLVRAAQRQACRTACSAPEGVCADHLVVTAWADLVRHVRGRDYDSVVVGGPPTRLGDRLIVRRAGWRSAQAARATAGHDVAGRDVLTGDLVSASSP